MKIEVPGKSIFRETQKSEVSTAVGTVIAAAASWFFAVCGPYDRGLRARIGRFLPVQHCSGTNLMISDACPVAVRNGGYLASI